MNSKWLVTVTDDSERKKNNWLSFHLLTLYASVSCVTVAVAAVASKRKESWFKYTFS